MKRLSILFGALLIALPSAARGAKSIVWLEAEKFEDAGGWVHDAQFVDQMGSPFLLAMGLGKPVRNAVTRVSLSVAGRYRLWVRSRDWMPEHHPGQFEVLLNGKTAGRVFGRSGKPGWRWEDGGPQSLPRGVKVELRDLTGYYGRCDVVVLAQDIEWTPPEDVKAIAKLRAEYGGVSSGIRNMAQYDVVVVGGGLAGCTAAVAAARNGITSATITRIGFTTPWQRTRRISGQSKSRRHHTRL